MDVGNIVVCVILCFFSLICGIKISEFSPQNKELEKLRAENQRLWEERSKFSNQIEKLTAENKSLKQESLKKEKNTPVGILYD